MGLTDLYRLSPTPQLPQCQRDEAEEFFELVVPPSINVEV